MKFAWVIAGVFGAAAAESPAVGAIVYLTQQRSIAANGFANGQPEGGAPLTAADFGAFDRTRMHTFTNNSGSAFAMQNSRLLPDSILMDGVARATILGPAVEIDTYSRLQVTFRLDAPSAYSVAQTHAGSMTIGGLFFAVATLSGPSGPVFDWRDSQSTSSSWPGGSVDGMLVAGLYTLRLEVAASGADGGGAFGPVQAAMSFALTIPNPTTAGGAAVLLGFGGFRRRRRQ